MNRNLSNCEKAWKKGFRGFNGIRTRGLCVSAAVLYQPELWRPIHWRPANLLSSSTRERNETQNEMMWTAAIQIKWVCDHRSESQFKQLRKSLKKRAGLKKREKKASVLRTPTTGNKVEKCQLSGLLTERDHAVVNSRQTGTNARCPHEREIC